MSINPFLLRIILLFLMGSGIPSLSQGQQDTILWDSFEDNRLNWPLGSDEKGVLDMMDGKLQMTRRQRGGSYYYRTYALANSLSPENFTYEVQIAPIQAKGFGVVLNRMKNKKGKTIEYTGFLVTGKEVSVYTYNFTSNRFWVMHRVKRAGLNTEGHLFRVEGKSGKILYWLNGELIYEHPLMKTYDYREWGFLIHGYGIIEVDHLLLLGTKAVPTP